MFESFKSKAEAAGCEVHRFASRTEAISFILHFMRAEGVADAPGSFAVWADGPVLKGLETDIFQAQIPGLNFTVTRQLAKDAKIGVTQMDWGIANTGTLAQDSSAVEQRLASALPAIHIALLGTNQIVADLPAMMTKLHPERNQYIALITGPSRTADIERVLAIGVHGPERLVMICVDEMEGMNQ
jgi:L-lactate dehydrogenase complex protein LldG